jgi:hypothetical protein
MIMAFLIALTIGYLLGGVSALVILGLTVAARRGDLAEERIALRRNER